MGMRTTGHPVWTGRLGKRYRRGWALRACSLALPPNRMVALVGANGSGKSTLMGLITGLLRPSEGGVEVFERRPTGACVPASLLIKNRVLVQDPGWFEQEPRLNDVVLAYTRDGQDTEVAA